MNLSHQKYLLINALDEYAKEFSNKNKVLNFIQKKKDVFIKHLMCLLDYTQYLKNVICTQQNEIEILEENIIKLTKKKNND